MMSLGNRRWAVAAECWGCRTHVAPVGEVDLELQGVPLGSCWECGVFGCLLHATRDRVSGKWLCYPSVARAISASAGIDAADSVPEELRFNSVADVMRRFAALFQAAEASEEARR